MQPQLLPAQPRDDVPAWTQSVVAFLAEKERRSGSRRTVEGYARLLWPFLSRVGSPGQVTPAHVLAWAYGQGASGREPSSATVGARIACLSSYFRFLIRMTVATANPCDALERPRTVQSVARGYSADEVRRLLAVVPDTVAGRRDRALLLTFVLTGRRRAEVIGLVAGDISVEGETAFYSYRGKGGKRGRRELPRPAYEALCATLADAGLSLAMMDLGASLWQAGAGSRGVTSSTFYARFRRYLRAAGLAPSGLHVLRHTAAKLRRDAGASIEAVSSFLDHSSLAVTSVYLRRLEGEADRTWPDVAVAIGV
ncbi:MAG TPA: tyrosine-type recombinase/integrase [Candidatus Saccharimonadales bacterium]|nr:tyrosine-type recombinase/integrase [Candidatus Saccharimonadales bacterium]